MCANLEKCVNKASTIAGMCTNQKYGQNRNSSQGSNNTVHLHSTVKFSVSNLNFLQEFQSNEDHDTFSVPEPIVVTFTATHKLSVCDYGNVR